MPKKNKAAGEEKAWEDMTRKERRRARKAGKGGGKSESESKSGNLVPDSTIGKKEYSNNIKWFLDEERLDPMNDPTMQPVLDAMKREAEEDFWNRTRDLRDQAASRSLLGTDYWTYQKGRAREEFDEGMQSNIASLMHDSRTRAEQQRLAALGQVNERDIAAGQFKTARATARIGAQPGIMAANLARQQWQHNLPFDDMRNTIGLMKELGGMSGYYETPGFTEIPQGYNGLSGWEAALGGLIGGGMNAYGAWKAGQ